MNQQRKAREVIQNLEEYKKILRQRQAEEDENLSELQLCRKYSKQHYMREYPGGSFL